jgi:hypothetical protein
MSTSNRVALAVCLLAGSMVCSSARADSAKNLEKQLSAGVNGKVYWLNKPYTGEKLEFDSTGQLIGNAETGSPAVNGLIQVTHLSLSGNALRVTGWRVVAVLSSNLGGTFSLLATGTPMLVTIHLALPISTEGDAQAVWAIIFAGGDPNERLAGFWKAATDETKDGSGGIEGMLDGKPVYGRKAGIARPNVEGTNSPNHHSPAGLSGLAHFSMVIDERGKPALFIAGGPPDPLQSDAISNFSGSTFKPTTKEGKAVPYLVPIEMEYHAQH